MIVELSKKEITLVYAGLSSDTPPSSPDSRQSEFQACFNVFKDVFNDVSKDVLFALSINYLARSIYENTLENLKVVPGLAGPTGFMCFLAWIYLSRHNYQAGRHKVTLPS